jgi:tRNA/rRNA methyltransferase
MKQRTIRLDHVAVVLCQPKLAENIGTTARAVVNMGLGRLILVEPENPDERVIRAVATRAADGLIDRMVIAPDLPAALADFHFVVGTTARLGDHRGPFFTPRTMAKKIVEMGSETRVALVFGTERSGLTTADLRLCQAVVRIPTADPKASSLNLAQAVLILGYDLLTAHEPSGEPPAFKPAVQGEVQAMYDHLQKTLLDIGFLPDQNPDHWLMSFKRLFNRTGLTHGDCNLLRGLCRQIAWVRKNGKPQIEP